MVAELHSEKKIYIMKKSKKKLMWSNQNKWCENETSICVIDYQSN